MPSLEYGGGLPAILGGDPGVPALRVLSVAPEAFAALEVSSSGMKMQDDMFYASGEDGGVLDISFKTRKPARRCELMAFFRVFNDPAKANRVSFSYSFDGVAYADACRFASDGSGRWDGMEFNKIFEIAFPGQGGSALHLRFHFTRDTGLAFEQTSSGTPYRRFQATFYPVPP